MYLIASFGVLMTFICTFMVVNPKRFSETIVTFSKQKWFHVVEISARAIMGVICIKYSDSTLYPTIFNILGYGLIVVAIGLVCLAPKKHKKFALWVAQNFESKFRVIGIISMPLGGVIIYMALGGNYV